MSQVPPAQTIATGLVVAIVGFFSSFPIVLQGLAGVGATTQQATTGLFAAAFAMGLAGIALSVWKRMPISVAWSTPGVAYLAVAGPVEGGFAGAVAAFVIAGLLTVLAGLVRPIGRLVSAIPAPLAQAMLAGVLLTLCIVPFQALAQTPETALPIIAAWFVAGRINRLFAVPAAVAVATVMVLIHAETLQVTLPNAALVSGWTNPAFSMESVLGLAVPLFIITMATQNIPGLAILKSYGYAPAPGGLLATVGGFSVISAPMGAPATCLAAITAAMCANEDSHENPSLRFWSAIFAGIFYCLFGLFSGVVTAVAAAAPALVLGTLAGIALLGTFTSATLAAFEPAQSREAAAVTFLVTASGITLFGLGAAVWGLVIGGLVYALSRRGPSSR